MTANQLSRDWNFGNVTVTPSSNAGDDSTMLCDWHPGADIAQGVPPGYTVSLQCSVAERRRQFLLATNFSTDFLLNTSLGGQIILALRDRPHEKELCRQDFYRLLYQRTWHTRDFFDRRFVRFSDLYIKKLGRIAPSEYAVLPDNLGLDDLGFDVRGNRKPWTLNGLIREGRDACRNAGQANPQAPEIIRRGLLRSAQQNPLFDCTPEQAQTLARMAIFAVTANSEEVNAAQVDWVEQQVYAVFMEHIDDDTERFNRILEDPKSDLVHRIAKRKKTPVGTLTRGQVRAALATIGWRAVQSLGDCFDAQMRAFQATLPKPLNRWETAQFEIAFLKQPCFGNLPLLLLKDRINFLRDAALDIFDKPGDLRRIAVFHRMLSYYDQMLGKRRPADRQYQQRRLTKNDDGYAADQVYLSVLPVELDCNKRTQNAGDFKEIVKHVLVKLRYAREADFTGD